MGPRRGGKKEGGLAAFISGDTCLEVANALTATLQLQGMALDVRHLIISGKSEVGRPRRCSSERKKATALRPIPSRGSGRKFSEVADWRRRRAGRLFGEVGSA
jgi:hypothetical protein